MTGGGVTGRVVLVGGGPGAVDLLTVRGLRALQDADVVVADRLGPAANLDLPARVRVIDVGKRPGAHSATQAEINAILVREALAGNQVARLKGGDCFLFGRGGEEIAACRAHGIEVDVIPGVSSVLAAPAAAHVPVTHRGTSSSVLVVHGHDQLSTLAVTAVVTQAATVVVLMGVARLADHVATLLDAGARADLPVVVIEQASTAAERVTRAPLDCLVEVCAAVGVRSPAVIVLGDVADSDLLGVDTYAHPVDTLAPAPLVWA